jgi:hypothetical protein
MWLKNSGDAGGQMTSTVTIDSESATGEHFQLTLEKVADDKGTIRIKSWRSDQDHHSESPDKDRQFRLYKIRASEDGSSLVCRGKAFGGDPIVSCKIHQAQPPKPALVRVIIKGTLAGLGDGTTDYVVGDDEHDRIRQFVLRAGFPTVPRKGERS